ncbi:MAG: class A beta-lactamase [Gemmatimonadota bacterium]|nr:class A beta-lactamase [Gemmatimonadota bacterium]
MSVVPLLIMFSLSLPARSQDTDGLIQTVKQVEKALGTRIGIAVYDEESGRNWQYHADDRFPMASTFKTLACAALLSLVDEGKERLERVVTFDESDLVAYSPVTKKHADARGMTLSELCEATMFVSDNSAANFILRAVGGPDALTEFVRSIGDEVTRLDRWEPDLNQARPCDKRDTTTPNAMALTIRKLVLGDVLSNESREMLATWLKGNQVGDTLFRSGVPGDWVVGDRTGAGGYGSRAIAAIMWPPKQRPVIATVYLTETEASFDSRNAAIAKIGASIASMVIPGLR